MLLDHLSKVKDMNTLLFGEYVFNTSIVLRTVPVWTNKMFLTLEFVFLIVIPNFVLFRWTNKRTFSDMWLRIALDASFWICYTIIGLKVVTALILDGFTSQKVT